MLVCSYGTSRAGWISVSKESSSLEETELRTESELWSSKARLGGARGTGRISLSWVGTAGGSGHGQGAGTEMKAFSSGKALGVVVGTCQQGCYSGMGASTGASRPARPPDTTSKGRDQCMQRHSRQ